jgi:hypothetical protein
MANPGLALSAYESARESSLLTPGPERLSTPTDDFEQAAYDPDFRSEGGGLSQYLMVLERNQAPRAVHLDAITPDQPHGWALKQETLRILDDYEAKRLYRAGLGVMFFLLTLSPAAGPAPSHAYRVTRRIVAKAD